MTKCDELELLAFRLILNGVANPSQSDIEKAVAALQEYAQLLKHKDHHES